MNEYMKKWWNENKEKRKTYNKRYRISHSKELRFMDRECDYGGNWKKTLDRDEWKCQFCKADLKKTRPQVHHKDGNGYTHDRTKINNSLKNLVSLCLACHKRLHILINNYVEAKAISETEQSMTGER